MGWAFKVQIPPCPKSVLISLANRADDDGYCWPGLEDLVQRTGWTRRAIQKAMRFLVEKELLTITSRHYSTGRQRSNLYRLSMFTEQGEKGESCSQIQVEGESRAPLRVNQVKFEGEPGSPKSSSESSEEQSLKDPEGTQARPRHRPEAKSSPTWERYRKAYEKKYGVTPIRDRIVNANLCKLVDRLGSDAPAVAEFYVTLVDPLYIRAKHSTNLLVLNAEALRTEYLTSRDGAMPSIKPRSVVELIG